ncbi:uncharacterized protein LOC125178830 [Hyalella azteca]|uniref:Uncharacterized protein LOC125178830 n=1 Tax=Hyalella azteca TaxID=294128 RepID=A0A979FTU7_HYAAZ|nr:uncharacterized protein LOC125178830 [Hyalella azteca]
MPTTITNLEINDEEPKSFLKGLPLNGTLIIGQEQDALSGSFSKSEILRGRIAQVNIWSRLLNQTEIISFSDCRTYLNFGYPEPDGGKNENCAGLFVRNPTWYDWACDDRRVSCAVCQRVPGRFMRLRGLCFASAEESIFELSGYVNKEAYFFGYCGWIIHRMEANHEWLIYDAVLGQSVALVQVSNKKKFPIGRNKWVLLRNQCGFVKGTSILLSLSSCSDDEFSCDSGQCLPFKFACNGVSDCRDGSDEFSCNVVLRAQDENSVVRPPSLEKITSIPTYIKTSVEVQRLTNINPSDSYIELEMVLHFTWDDFRLTFRNLQDQIEFNRLTSEEEAYVWKPTLIFYSAYNGEVSVLSSEVHVSKLGTGMLSDFNSVERASLFNRGSGLLVNTQHVSGKFACVFDVFRYPFDAHRCELLVRLGFSSERLVTFTNDRLSLVYTGANKLKEFNVQNMTAIASSVNFRNSSNTELKVKKIIGNHRLSN